jgi:hypothetical protein
MFGTAAAAAVVVLEETAEVVPVLVKELEEDFLFRLCFEFEFEVFIQSLGVKVIV